MLPFFVTIPHSGEKVPDLCPWLRDLPEPVLMCDVDRYVDQLYAGPLRDLSLPFLKTEWHRYAADLNRVPGDVDASSVRDHQNSPGTFSRGFHWVITTKRDTLMSAPMSLETHTKLVELIYEPFHRSVRELYEKMRDEGAGDIFHLDAHSMPSVGTREHRDPGEGRADIVVSDNHGKSAREDYVNLVIQSYVRAGFKVGYNWPYYGGRVTEQYGDPARGRHALQVELNRSLYMDEDTKKLDSERAARVSGQLRRALESIRNGLQTLKKENT